MALAGKYEIVENINFYELLLKLDIPEETAKLGNELKSTLEIQVDGKKIRLIHDDDAPQKNITELILDEEVDEKPLVGSPVKSTAKLNGNVLTVDSKPVDGTPGGKRTLTVTDTGLEVKIIPLKEDLPTATRIYKRV